MLSPTDARGSLASASLSLPTRCSPLSAVPPSPSPSPRSQLSSVSSSIQSITSNSLHAPTRSHSVGGPWADFVSRSDASMAKLLVDSLPKTRATRAAWLASHQELDDGDKVAMFEFVDLYACAVALVLLPAVVAAYLAVLLASIPALSLAKLYMSHAMARPTKSVQRGPGFQALAVALWVLALPCHLAIACYWLLLFPALLLASALYSLFSLKILLVQENLEVLRSCSHWPKWLWRDTVCALLGAMDRQGFLRFVVKFPSAVVVVPILKYLFGANPLLYRLKIRQRSLWTSSLGGDDEKAVAAVVQSVSWTLVNLTELIPVQISKPLRQDNRIVSGHLPFPATDRVSGTTMGVLTPNGLVAFANVDHNVNGSVFQSMTAKRGIYNLLLFSWNPCHPLTGYVEVNLQHEGGIEQAMWCVVGDNYLGNLLFERADALFWHYDPIKRGARVPGPVDAHFVRGSLASTLSSANDSVLAVDGSDEAGNTDRDRVVDFNVGVSSSSMDSLGSVSSSNFDAEVPRESTSIDLSAALAQFRVRESSSLASSDFSASDRSRVPFAA